MDNKVNVYSIETGTRTAREALTMQGGSWRKRVGVIYSAILVEHPKGNILFDTGLGRKIDQQYAQDMPKWKYPLMRYGNVNAARDQLKDRSIERIFLSHVHWDHASGLPDFPDAEVWVTQAEKNYLGNYIGNNPGVLRASVLPSQFTDTVVNWNEYSFADKPHLIFCESYDVFNDGTVVVVPLPGHTPGSVGMFVHPDGVASEGVFFCGDTVWRKDAIKKHKNKFWLARKVVDHDPNELAHSMEMLKLLLSEYPGIDIVPAHDKSAHQKYLLPSQG